MSTTLIGGFDSSDGQRELLVLAPDAEISCSRSGKRSAESEGVAKSSSVGCSSNRPYYFAELRIAIDQDHGCVHYTVSPSISSYSACVPKDRITKTPA